MGDLYTQKLKRSRTSNAIYWWRSEQGKEASNIANSDDCPKRKFIHNLQPTTCLHHTCTAVAQKICQFILLHEKNMNVLILKEVNDRDMGLPFRAQWPCKEVLLCKANEQFATI